MLKIMLLSREDRKIIRGVLNTCAIRAREAIADDWADTPEDVAELNEEAADCERLARRFL